METATEILPHLFERFVAGKLERNGEGGRPHFVQILAKEHDPKEEILNILEQAWIKNKTPRAIAQHYKVTNMTIYRLIQQCKPFKENVVENLLTFPRRKQFYNEQLNSSDYETVQNFINRARRDGLKNYKRQIKNAMRCWRALNYRDPATWCAQEILTFFDTLTLSAQSFMLDAVRQVAPQLALKGGVNELKVGRFRERIARRKKDIFGAEVTMIKKALFRKRMTWQLTILLLHIATGAREGSEDNHSGLSGLTWDRFKTHFTKVDLWESKVRGGIWSRDCPLDLLFPELPKMLEAEWVRRGKPISDKLIQYKDLCHIYKDINKTLADCYRDKLEASVYKEITTLRPHDADKIHINLLWEAGAPLEIVAGQYLGNGEGLGLMGRIWLNVGVIQKYYLSLTARSKRFQQIKRRVAKYGHELHS
jgi:hypothetical protein